MIILIVILHVIASLFLIAVILLQAGRGQGLSWGVFGGSPQSILGTKTASFLSRVTTGCAIIFLFTCILLNIIETRKSRSLITPSQPISKLDFSKIKDALEKAAATKGATSTQDQTQQPSPAPTTPNSTIPQTPQEKSTLPDVLPPPPEKH